MKIFNGINTANFSEISHGHTHVSIEKIGIIKIKASNHKYTIKDIKLIIKSIGFFTKKKQAKILILLDDFSALTYESSLFILNSESLVYSFAEAFVVKSFSQKMILMNNFRTKKVSTRFFDNENEAIAWLKSIKFE